MELLSGGGEVVIRKAASPGRSSSLVPQECLCFSSVSLNVGEGCVYVKVCNTLEETEAFVFASRPSLKIRLT